MVTNAGDTAPSENPSMNRTAAKLAKLCGAAKHMHMPPQMMLPSLVDDRDPDCAHDVHSDADKLRQWEFGHEVDERVFSDELTCTSTHGQLRVSGGRIDSIGRTDIEDGGAP